MNESTFLGYKGFRKKTGNIYAELPEFSLVETLPSDIDLADKIDNLVIVLGALADFLNYSIDLGLVVEAMTCDPNEFPDTVDAAITDPMLEEPIGQVPLELMDRYEGEDLADDLGVWKAIYNYLNSYFGAKNRRAEKVEDLIIQIRNIRNEMFASGYAIDDIDALQESIVLALQKHGVEVRDGIIEKAEE